MATSDFKVGKGVVAQNASTFTSGSFSGQITSTVTTGTAPFIIASTTEVANLRAALVSNLAGGTTGAIVYQSAASTSAFLSAGTQNYFLVSGGTGAAPTYVQPTLSTTYFAATTSSALANIISDETGSGVLVFGTSPEFTTSVTSAAASTTFAVFNTNATTINAFGAATALNLGASTGTATVANATVTLSNATTLNVNGASPTLASSSTGTLTLFNTNLTTVNAFGAATTATEYASATSLTIGGASGAQTITIGGASIAASTYNFGTGTTANATTKTINIGTGGAAGSVTNINIGSASATANSSTTTMNTKLIVKGDLQVDGTTTTVNSTTITVDDPILVLGGDTVPTSDDNLDRGIEFRWYTGASAKLGFFGYDDSTGNLTFVPDATDTNSVISGAIGSTDIRTANALTFNSTGGASANTSWNNSAAVTVDYSTVGAAASSHTHGNITNAGAIGSTSGLVVVTTASGVLNTLAAGTTSQWLRGDGTYTAVTSLGAVTVDTGAYLDYNAVTIAANTATTVHSFAGATYRSAKFLLQLTQGTKYRVSEVTVLHDGTTAYAAEYGIVETGGTMTGITVDGVYSAGTINLQVTVTDAATTNVASKALLTALIV